MQEDSETTEIFFDFNENMVLVEEIKQLHIQNTTLKVQGRGVGTESVQEKLHGEHGT